MHDTTETPRVPPETVGQEPLPQGQNRSGMGGFLRANLLTWIMVVIVAVVFVVAIIVFAT